MYVSASYSSSSNCSLQSMSILESATAAWRFVEDSSAIFCGLEDLLPRMQRFDVLSSEKQSFVRTQERAKLPVMFLFSLILSDTWLKNFIKHSTLIPPKQVKTSGVKQPCSTFCILSLYFLFFSFSLDLCAEESDWFR